MYHLASSSHGQSSFINSFPQCMVRHLRWVDSGCHLLRGTKSKLEGVRSEHHTIPPERISRIFPLGRRRGENEGQSRHSFQICKELSFPKEICFIGPQNSELRPMNGNARKVQYKEGLPNGVTQNGHFLYQLVLS